MLPANFLHGCFLSRIRNTAFILRSVLCCRAYFFAPFPIVIGCAAFKLSNSVGILPPLRLLTEFDQAVDKRQSTPEYTSIHIAVQSCIHLDFKESYASQVQP